MKKILITGGTVFVSRYAAQYFVDKGYEVYVVNRNSRPQVPGVKLIETDRHDLGDKLKDIYFDVVADITAYNAEDITDLCDSLGSFGQYIMISSSAVYPEYGDQPFREDSERALNRYWGSYGTDKIAAEDALLDRVSDAYILRPPYIYGPMNNVYREAFVFDCARADRPFYLPGDGGDEAAVLPCEGSLYPDGESNRGKAGDSYHECGKCGAGHYKRLGDDVLRLL